MMLNFFKNLFSSKPAVDLDELIRNGAQIIDVRTRSEFKDAHLKKSENIPLQQLQGNLGKIKKDKPVIVCCASGMRSASARRLLKSNGFSDVHNGGSWMNLRRYEK